MDPEVMNRSFIDDNGNPCDDSDSSDGNEVIGIGEEGEQMFIAGGGGSGDEPPRYFINAAELSEDDTGFFQEDEEPQIHNAVAVGGITNDQGQRASIKVTEKPQSNSKSRLPAPKIRSRVPVSKSYPDIVQTTFTNEEMEKEPEPRDFKALGSKNTMAKENSDLESLVADSLENLSLLEGAVNPNDPPKKEMEKSRIIDPDERPIRGSSSRGGGIMDSSAMMTESQMCGIIGEKPPSSWVIDLNSLSMDASDIEIGKGSISRSRCGSGNSNSMAFFVKMNDKDKEQGMSESMSSSTGPEKKIFSMFVDINESGSGKKLKSNIPNLKKPIVVNKPVMNVMETSTGSMNKSMTMSNSMSNSITNSRKPSPIFQHKAAAEAARKAARLEWETQREKYLDSLEPASMMMMMGLGAGTGSTPSNSTTISMGESTLSNRSSLHVANVLESSFSSSIISSMEASNVGELEICQGGPCFKLGKDLLRMFQEGINTDVIISVNGKWIKAHKCILASRSQYFAAILSGHWVEKAGNTINLDGFSYSVVQFALYHIYSGTPDIPDTIDLLELASLTDLLGLESLRENISDKFRVKFCHNFHRPCTTCITGVLECFPIAVDFGMDDLHRKMIKWICKHFVRIWPTKGFASLGEELREKCLRYSINHLSVENILDHTLGSDQLLTTMPTLRWTEPIFNIVNQLALECVTFVGENLSDVLQSQKFLQFGKGQAWNISRIEDTFMQSMTLLKPDMACLAHTALTRLIELGTETIDEVEWSTSFVEFLTSMRNEVEKYLLANGSKAVLSKCWEELTPAFRKKICSTSFVGYDKFGNKIVKNSGGGSSTGAGGGGNSSNSNSRGTTNSTTNKSSTRPAPMSAKPPVAANRVASVKPMQSQHRDRDIDQDSQEPHENHRHHQPPKTSRTLISNVGRSATMSSTKSDADSSSSSRSTVMARNQTASKAKTPTAAPKKIGATERPSISRRASTASPTHSAARTPKQPLTPSVPSPLTGFEFHATSQNPKTTKRAVSASAAKSRGQPAPVPEPPKKAFLTNSAKAAAVSKPILKGPLKRASDSSSSSLNSGQTHSLSPTPSTKPSIAKSYLTNNSSKPPVPTFSARNSFSNLERPKDSKEVNRSKTTRVNAKVEPSKIVKMGQNSRSNSATTPTTTCNSAGKGKRPSSSSGTGVTKPTPVPRKNPPQVPVQDKELDFQSFTESFQPDSLNQSQGLMSKSTVEMESGGEVNRMRTLAEIGRSSTFSKDEPTILGKIDYDYDEYE